MAAQREEIEAKLVGGQQVEQEASRISKALSRVGDVVSSNIKPALQTVGGAMGNLISDGLRAAGVLQTISLANAVEDAKRLDLVTAKLGQSAGVSGTLLRSNFDAVEKKTLTSSVAMADFSRSLGRATYDSKFAADSVGALGEEALAVGRDLGDELPLAVALRDTGVAAKDLPAELGRIRDMAEQVGTVGGHMALKDTLAALAPQLAGVATQTDEARAKLEALVAVLGKGLKPQQAQAVGAAALQTIRSRAMDIERVTGRRVLDDSGQLVDPTKTLQDLKALADKRFGAKNTEAKRRALMSDFGQDLGLAIFRTDFGEVGKLAASATDRGKTAAEAEKFRLSKEGKRIEAGLAKDQAMRGVGAKLAGVHDTLVDKLGVPGALGVELVGGQVALAGAKALGGKLLAGGVTAAGAGTAAAGVAAAGVLAGQVGLVASLGENRDVMGARYRSERAQALGQDIAAAAIARGDLSKVIGRAKGDKEIQAATMEALLLKFDQLNATLQGQANAYAEAVGRKTLKVAMPVDPNAPKGN
jgi:hypothetical protein